jgi:hypothetical protein
MLILNLKIVEICNTIVMFYVAHLRSMISLNKIKEKTNGFVCNRKNSLKRI